MLSENVSNFMLELSIWAVPTIFSIVAHEVMHGEVAKHLGDDTAQRAGRLTLNPISHVDPFGTIILPAILLYFGLPVFGWAKPVPVDFSRLRNGRTGMVMVAAAGPLTNLTLAVVSAMLARQLPQLLDPQAWRVVVVPLHLHAASVGHNQRGAGDLQPAAATAAGRRTGVDRLASAAAGDQIFAPGAVRISDSVRCCSIRTFLTG